MFDSSNENWSEAGNKNRLCHGRGRIMVMIDMSWTAHTSGGSCSVGLGAGTPLVSKQATLLSFSPLPEVLSQAHCE